jgi:hypothetical protein
MREILLTKKRKFAILVAVAICFASGASALDMTKPVYLAKGAIVCPEVMVALQFEIAKLHSSTNEIAARETVDQLFTPPLRHGCETVPERIMIRMVGDESRVQHDALVTVERLNDRPGNHPIVFGRSLQN